MRRIVIDRTRLIDMQCIGHQVQLVLDLAVGEVAPGDVIVTKRYGTWKINSVLKKLELQARTVSAMAELIESGSNRHFF